MNPLLELEHPVIGHRGNRAHAPENTIESFAQAVALGADAIEFDVRLSADGIPVVHHDPVLGRTSDGSGELARRTFAELRRADAGAKFTKDGGKSFPYRGHGHLIPTFEEVMEAFPVTPLLIEIKAPLAATGVRRIIEQHKAQPRVLVDSYHSSALRIFEGAGVALGAGRGRVARLLWDVVKGGTITPVAAAALSLPLSYYGLPLPIRRFAQVLPDFGCRLNIWTINSTQMAKRLWAMGVNGIISDDPAAMLKLRASLPS